MDVLLASLLAAALAFAAGLHAERSRWLQSADDFTTSMTVGDEQYDVLSVSGWEYRPHHASDPDPEVSRESVSLAGDLLGGDLFPEATVQREMWHDYVHERAEEMGRDFFHGTDTR